MFEVGWRREENEILWIAIATIASGWELRACNCDLATRCSKHQALDVGERSNNKKHAQWHEKEDVGNEAHKGGESRNQK